MTGSADAAVVNLFHACCPTLLDDFGCKIDLVLRRANAGAELGHELLGFDCEPLLHQRDRVRSNLKFGAFAPRMNESDGALFAVDQIKRAAIGDINAQTNISLVRDQGVTILKTNVPVQRRINHSHFAPVNLSCDGKGVAK